MIALLERLIKPLLAPVDEKVERLMAGAADLQARVERIERHTGMAGAIEDIARELSK